MRRLYLRIYLAFLGVVLACVVVAGGVGRVLGTPREHTLELVSASANMLDTMLRDAPGERLEHDADYWADRFDADFGIWRADGRMVVRTADHVTRPSAGAEPGWHRHAQGHGMWIRLDDGGWFVGIPRDQRGFKFVLALALLMLVMALGCYPIARGITRRLETLREGVDQWGQGKLETRVAVQGRDEVADLAITFNHAALRLSDLLKQQRRVLAHASHELRSPLTRLRMAIELLADQDTSTERRTKLIEDAERDIVELDELVGDVLLAARLEDSGQPRRFESVQLESLLEEEAQRVGGRVTAEPVSVQGNPRMLRRLLRNLLENARRHGGGTAIEARLARDGQRAVIVVADSGPGIPESERERVFEPFYRPAGQDEEGGAGLGLSLVRQIAEHHRGSVQYRAKPGGGSQFEVRLPAA